MPAPSYDTISPDPGAGAITRDTPINLFIVTGSDLTDRPVILALFHDGATEVVWDSVSGTAAGYVNGSSAFSIGAGSYDITILRNGGWKDDRVTIQIVAFTVTGEVLDPLTHTWDVSNPLPVVGGGDSTPPTISNFSPTADTPIARTAPISFDVTDDVGFRRVILAARFADGAYDIVYDGDAFASKYAALSSRSTLITGRSFRYQLRRSGGWPSSPEIVPFVVDLSGNELP